MSSTKIVVGAACATFAIIASTGIWAMRKIVKTYEQSMEKMDEATKKNLEQILESVHPHEYSETEIELKNLFNSKYDDADTHEVIFNPKWANGTGYYDGACYDKLPEVKIGGFFASFDPKTKRSIIGKKIGVGQNIVVFERYTANGSTPFIVVSNAPDGFEPEGFEGSIKHEDLVKFFES